MSVALSLVVLYVADLGASVEFYTGLGLHFAAEQHGAGPVHYSAAVGGTLLELYPCGNRPVTRTRLGLRVEAAAGAGAVRDPDGNVVELHQLQAAEAWLLEWAAPPGTHLPGGTLHHSEAGARVRIEAVAVRVIGTDPDAAAAAERSEGRTRWGRLEELHYILRRMPLET